MATVPNQPMNTSAALDAEIAKELDLQRRRSAVRVNVTYLVTIAFLATGMTLVVWLAIKEEFVEAVAIFSTIAAAASGIIGFWFGTRGQGGTTADKILEPLKKITEAPDADEGAAANDPKNTKAVTEIQRLLARHAKSLPSPRLREAVDPGVVDGVLGEATISAIDNFLSLQDPPDRFKDLAEPKLEKVLALLKAARSG